MAPEAALAELGGTSMQYLLREFGDFAYVVLFGLGGLTTLLGAWACWSCGGHLFSRLRRTLGQLCDAAVLNLSFLP